MVASLESRQASGQHQSAAAFTDFRWVGVGTYAHGWEWGQVDASGGKVVTLVFLLHVGARHQHGAVATQEALAAALEPISANRLAGAQASAPSGVVIQRTRDTEPARAHSDSRVRVTLRA
jgi:hypothetical protein